MTIIDVSDERETAIGHVRLLAVEGPWTEACTDRFAMEACDGVVWYPPKRAGQDCRPFVEVADRLRMLQINAAGRVDDSAIADLTSLEFVDARTSGKNDLDLRRLNALRHLSIDDRPGLAGIDPNKLLTIELWATRRHLYEFGQGSALQQLELELEKSHALRMRASLPNLRLLRIAKGRVIDLAGLDAPALETLVLDAQSGPDVLDLAPLAELSSLRHLTVRGPIRLENLHLLGNRESFSLSTSPRVVISPAEASRLPVEWNIPR